MPRNTRSSYKSSTGAGQPGTSQREIGQDRSGSQRNGSREPTCDHEQIENLTRLARHLQVIPKHRYTIAIDYGTTFSAVAHTSTSVTGPQDRKAVNLTSIKPSVIQQYPVGGGTRGWDDEVPTLSLYLGDGGREFYWGNGVFRVTNRPGVDATTVPILDLVKLDLSESEELKEERDRIQQKLRKSDVPITKAIADFLREVWRYTCQTIASEDGESHFQQSEKRVVLSVPPAWSAKAVRVMLEAAAEAGLPSPQIVAEQEAAALAVLIERGVDKKQDFQIGNTFLVVDAGGGTVDVAAYLLEQKDPFGVSEVSSAEGLACGSSLLNLAFRDWLEEMLRADKDKYSEAEFKKLLQAAPLAFEWTKREFDGLSQENWYCRISGIKESSDGRFAEDFVCISREQMCRFFDSIIDEKIIPMIRSQIREIHENSEQLAEKGLIKYIVIVGGFCASKYLQKKIRDAFTKPKPGAFPDYGIEILTQTRQHQTIVARGSVLRALNGNFVRQRRLRTSYGIKQDELFEAGTHDKKLREQDEHEDRQIVRDCILWVYRSGKLLKQDEHLQELELHWTVDLDFDFKNGNRAEEFTCEIWMSDEKDPLNNQTVTQMEADNKRE
ncbi:hypothetical protein G647_10311 [Cladophialophora carrionii CBS 160.54]|uniref:Uncharacterized protein n=1 Tax=Cladophialophora carrionii CBS 160.54 TaxID=1279043 RepID=V9DJ48_9EURO|nr:uncharacterized protein G647_10311 [Cladophialophora carrionii CBS 160.54]ETI26865.1 hypothetical protein G647_10311 [Cladophialophora carrionii CBS 160.54]